MENAEWPVHEKIYDGCMEMARNNPGYAARKWIHLSDAVERGSVSPMDAYDALSVGFVPENLKVRDSLYSHTL